MCVQVVDAKFPIPSLPELPMFGEFNPNKLRVKFNQFVGVEPDFSRENRMIEQIEDAVLDGDVEYLPLKNGKEIFSIYMQGETNNPESDKPRGGVIILHNRGQHANWDDVIRPLRVGLAAQGWDTLSVQMPVLDKQAKYYDYVPIFPYSHQRIKAAINFFRTQGISNIVLIAHGCGVHMLMSYIDKYSDKAFSAFVGIGMGATDYKQKLVNGFPLDKMSVPVLDIYGEQDFAGVKRLAAYRKGLISAGHPKSQQVVVKNAGHYYQAQGTAVALIADIDAWLNTLADRP